MEIKKFVNNAKFSCNLYVISKNENILIIDPGFYNDEIKNYIKSKGIPKSILLTHGHFDHINSIDEIKKDYPNIDIYISKEDKDCLYDSLLNLSYVMNYDLKLESKVNVINSDFLKLDDFFIKVIKTPGHTYGSVMYYFSNEDVIFTGDTIMASNIGTTRFTNGDEQEMQKTLNMFKKLNLKGKTKILSGHGEETNYQDILIKNEYLNFFD